MSDAVVLTVLCQRKWHKLAEVVDHDGLLYVQAPKVGQSRRHEAAGTRAWRPLDAGAGRRYGCGCGSALLRDKALQHAIDAGYKEFVAQIG